MAQRGRGSRGRSFRGRGAGGSRHARGTTTRRNGFRASRVQDIEYVAKQEYFHTTNISRDDAKSADDQESISESDISQQDAEGQSASEDETSLNRLSYATLLQTLSARQDSAEPLRKKRRLEEKEAETRKNDTFAVDEGVIQSAELSEPVEEELNIDVEIDSDEEEAVLQDPFEKHYTNMSEETLSQGKAEVVAKRRQFRNTVISPDMKKTEMIYNGQENATKSLRTEKDLKLKQKLLEPGSRMFKTLSNEERDITGELLAYKDVQYGARTVSNAQKLRDIVSLHALNHIFKTRDRVLKNNAKATQQTGEETAEFRDQGFTRPKVLIIVPTKQACARFVDSIISISEPDQQENKSRFLDTYSATNDDSWENKPDDFKELFGGNHEEDFRVGLKFTRKTIKYFSGFYNSDIILSSALGLMRTITTGGGASSKEKKKSHDADFLSSIEMVIVDNASAIQMQNWQHLEYVFSQLNLLPKDSHGCDFSRVRHWYLDGNAQYLRQTIVVTAYHTPEINALLSAYTQNINGLCKYTPKYSGAMLSLPPSLPFNPSQTFLRFNSPTPTQDSDNRFTYFTTSILPTLLRQSAKGILIFIPTYADFVRLRNHFSTSSTTTSLSFGSMSEYTAVRDVARARSHFMNGRHSILIYSERAHHHFRYKLKGVTKIVFYGVPENPIFWGEVVGMLGLNDPSSDKFENNSGRNKGTVRALFSRWDVLKLERIVGSERVGRLISEMGGDTFEFV